MVGTDIGGSGLDGWLLGLTPEHLASRGDPAILTEFGHLTEASAVNEILKQASWSDQSLSFGHFRTRDNHEVDLVIEGEDEHVVTVEIKATGRVPGHNFTGPRRLSDQLRDRFLGGVVLYLGERSHTYENRLHVIPLDQLWLSHQS